jgi:hypothetical protein
MTLKRDRNERLAEARRRLREQPSAPPARATRPRANAEVDPRDLQRSLERLEAVIGR